MNRQNKPQEWVCEVCGISGTTYYKADAGPFEVVYAIEAHHDRLAKEHAPYCTFDVHRVRVRNPALMDPYAWNRFVARQQRDLAEREP